jgi:uncharacterized protein (TIGR03118 family)
MKYPKIQDEKVLIFFLMLLSVLQLFLFQSCSDSVVSSPNSVQQNVQIIDALRQVNLVSDVTTYHPQTVDPNLVNAWGIVSGSTEGQFMIMATETNTGLTYDGNGNAVSGPVQISGSPTGAIRNTTHDFIIQGMPAEFIFAGENGTISGWISGRNAITVIDRSAADAVYKGLAIASSGGANYLYAADFHNGRIDVFDGAFNYMANIQLTDPNIPVHWAPFNILNVNNSLYVTYAQQKAPEYEDDDPGAGRGLVNIFSPNASLSQRFATGGTLNSPWGMAVTTQAFDGGGNILIANFGDGKINVYGRNGNFIGQLGNQNGEALSIEGLWGIGFYPPHTTPERLFFTAGPADEEHGLFGYLIR